MDPKRDIGIKMILLTLFMTSTLFSSLWMAGFLENESVSYTRYQHVVEAKEQPNQEIIKREKDKTSIENQLENTTINSSVEQAEKQSEVEVEKEKEKEVFTDDFLEVILENQRAEDEKQQKAKASSIPKSSIDIAFDLELLESELDLSRFPTKQVLATGYTAGFESTGKNPDHPQYGITYSGVQVRRDLYSTIAADTNVFPIGTILYIPGYGYGVVADTGGAIRGDKIDLYFENVEDVFQIWGKQQVNVYIIQKGEGKLTEMVLDHLNQDESVLAYKASVEEKIN